MKIKWNSISVKVTIIYIFLAILNISFFSVMIYENQVDLITENARFQAEKLTGRLISNLEEAAADKDSKLFAIKTKEEAVHEITKIIDKVVSDYIIFNEKKEILFKSKPEFEIKNKDILAGMKAVTDKDFTGKDFYSFVDENTYEIYFYIPFKFPHLKDSILLFNYKMKDISNRLTNLYSLITLLIIAIALVHVLFAFFLYKILIKPIQKLHFQSTEISEGNLSARVILKRNDELGELGKAFNSMADSIQEKINVLQTQDEIMKMELEIANEIQQVIYPKARPSDPFIFSVYHQALEKVSGDYHDIFSLGNGKYGILIVDVSGHGVPAALITMIAKEKFKIHAPLHQDPADLFQTLNNEICDILEDYNAYFTAFYFTVDSNYNLSFCNAGHPEALLASKDTNQINIIETDGPPIGMSREFSGLYQSKTIQVKPGDKIILFTDGITEAQNINKEQFTSTKLIEKIKEIQNQSPESIVNSVKKNILEFTGGTNKFKDDVTLFVTEIK